MIKVAISILLSLTCCSANSITCSNNSIPERFFDTVLDDMSPSSFCPPMTDDGAQPPFKYPFSFAHRGRYSGGWTRQVTVRDLPVATRMAGVQMRLIKGGIREMHWHVAGEWAYMIWGNVRITAVEPNGRAFVADVKQGDLWFFPPGFPHSIQGTGDDGGFFLLVFNEGNFNEFGTLLLTDYMNHIPKEVLSKNFQMPQAVFANIPIEPLYIFAGQLPQPLETELIEAGMGTGFVSQSLAFYTNRMRPNYTRRGGSIKVVDANNFPVTDIAASIITLKPGGLREIHWHPNADEWQYYVTGKIIYSI